MRVSPIVTLGASVAIGAVALFAARGYLKPNEAEATAYPEAAAPVVPTTRAVVVAKRNIPRGGAIDSTRLEIVEWPLDSVPEGSFMTIGEIGSTEFATRRALMPIEIGQAVLDTALTDVGERPTLAARLADGYRAYTLRMSDVTGVGGFVLPGDRIDVLFTWDQSPESRTQNLITEVLLQNVEVLGVDLNDDLANEEPSIFKNATIAVSVLDAQKLSLAAQTGTLSFMLRGIEDNEIGEFSAQQLSTGPIASNDKPAPMKRAAPRTSASNGPVRVDVLSGEQAVSFNVPRS